MAQHDLFEVEIEALREAQAVLAKDDLAAQAYRDALANLMTHFERLMRETRRLIRHGDRVEQELSRLNSELYQIAARLDYKARHDALTGALNSGATFDRATTLLRQGALAVILFDIDHFKRINDQFGHLVGDTVICEAIKRITGVLADDGEIGRVGGDEFAVLLPGVSFDAAVELAGRLCECITGRPFVTLPDYRVSASFGVTWTSGVDDFKIVYAQADEALYAAKRGGRNGVMAARLFAEASN
jgi:diguanylate cyclase (GGDEF)-like protein